MTCSEILTKSILALVLFVCQAAHSLETGCKYPSNVSVENSVLHDDLKCTYLYSALTHLLVTKQLAGPPFFLRSTLVINKIVHYNNIARSQMYSLYRLNVMRMDALWLLHLYLAMVHDFYDKSTNKMEDFWKITATHDYVIAQLRKDLTDCRKDNSFNNEWKIISKRNPTEKHLRYVMTENVDDAKGLLTRNKHEYIGNALQIGNLILGNIGSRDDFRNDLMDAFNVQVDWYGTGELLSKTYCDVRRCFWSANKFEHLKLYYKLSFNFLKIIMLRLTLKHLYYLEPYFGKDLYVHYAKEWYFKVQKFSDMLSLAEDLHVKNLLISLDNLVKQEEKIDSVAHYIIVILNELCLPLGCVATKPFELNEQEFETRFKSTIKNDDLKINKSLIPIEYRSLENTRGFLYYLRSMFKYNDFNLNRLLMEYSNEVSETAVVY